MCSFRLAYPIFAEFSQFFSDFANFHGQARQNNEKNQVFYEKTENIHINEHYDPFSGPKDHF